MRLYRDFEKKEGVEYVAVKGYRAYCEDGEYDGGDITYLGGFSTIKEAVERIREEGPNHVVDYYYLIPFVAKSTLYCPKDKMGEYVEPNFKEEMGELKKKSYWGYNYFYD